MVDPSHYSGREQSYVKHCVLEQYLERLAYKVGSWARTITYVDGFAGPWQSHAEGLEDTSPFIAIRTLASVQRQLEMQKPVAPLFSCLFVEKDEASFERLKAETASHKSPNIQVLLGEFESSIPDILARTPSGPKSFSFYFIDPTGWAGFGMRAITPILRRENTEVLINFMTQHIVRFIDDTDSHGVQTFVDLYGDVNHRDRWRGLSGLDRRDAIVDAYCSRVRETGGFSHVVSAVILNPRTDRPHFHLIYATRHPKGLRTFREVEKSAMEKQERVRASVHDQRRRSKDGQGSLFSAEVTGSTYYQDLRDRYTARSRQAVQSLLVARKSVGYDELELFALGHAMTWPSDLVEWLADWKSSGRVQLVGLRERQRGPRYGEGHEVRWIGP